MPAVLDKLLDPAEYETIPHVAILDEHIMRDGAGRPERVVDVNLLDRIARNNNTRVDRTGDPTPLIVGHTKDGKAEKDQPSVVGFATNFVVDKFFKTGKRAIYADLHIKRDKLDELKKISPGWRRSVELWTDGRWEVDPIALLAATTPERDLGLLLLERGGSKRVCYSRVLERDVAGIARRYARHIPEPDDPAETDDMADAAPAPGGASEGVGGFSPDQVQAIMQIIDNSAIGQWAQQQMAAGDQGGAPGGSGAPMPGGDDQGNMDDLLGPEGDPGAGGGYGADEPMPGGYGGGPPPGGPGDYGYGPEDEDAMSHGPPPVHYGGYPAYTPPPPRPYAGYTSAGNSYLPSSSTREPAMPMSRRRYAAAPAPTAPERLNQDKQAATVAELQKQVAALQAALAERDKQVRYERREKEIARLTTTEGFDVANPGELFEAVKDLPDAEYGRQLSTIRQYGRKDLTRVVPLTPEQLSEPAPVRLSRDEAVLNDPIMRRRAATILSKSGKSPSEPGAFAWAMQEAIKQVTGANGAAH